MLLYCIKDTLECDDIISDINLAMASKNYHDYYPLDGVRLEISSPFSTINNVIRIPSEDLKAIILEWKKFLETPSFNNQEMF